MIQHKSRVKETASNKPNSSTAFNLPRSTSTGYRTFYSSISSGNQCPYFATNGTDWESGVATFTSGTPDTLTRVILNESSTSSFIDWTSGASVDLFIEWPAIDGGLSLTSRQALTPGGRLTLESGVPVSSTDQTAKTNIYYTPYIHNIIVLWDGYQWRPIEFTEYTFAIGTGLTANLPYDLFAYLNNGALAIEKLAWTSNTTRATAISFQDGRYCKSGDKTRLYLGTFSPYSTTQVARSKVNCGLWNLYNQVPFGLKYDAGQSNHTYSPGAPALQEYAGASSVHIIRFVNGLPVNLPMGAFCQLATSTAGSGVSILANLDNVTTFPTAEGMPPSIYTSLTTTNLYSAYGEYSNVVVGSHKITLCDRQVTTGTYTLTANYGLMWGDLLS